MSAGDDTSDFGAAARVYWTLKVLGLKELSILNGGVQAWEAARLPLEEAPVAVAASSYAPVPDRSLIATLHFYEGNAAGLALGRKAGALAFEKAQAQGSGRP